MDIKQIKEYAPLIAAMARGEIVQIKNTVGHPDWTDLVGDKWTNLFLESDSRLGVKYRIKPTPKLRAWKAEEVPVGALIDVWSGDNSLPSVIVAAEHRSLSTVSGKEIVALTYEECLRDGKYSRDGKTWLPCGIEE